MSEKFRALGQPAPTNCMHAGYVWVGPPRSDGLLIMIADDGSVCGLGSPKTIRYIYTSTPYHLSKGPSSPQVMTVLVFWQQLPKNPPDDEQVSNQNLPSIRTVSQPSDSPPPPSRDP